MKKLIMAAVAGVSVSLFGVACNVGPTTVYAWSLATTPARVVERDAAGWVNSNTHQNILDSQYNGSDTVLVTAYRPETNTTYRFYFTVEKIGGRLKLDTPPRSIR